MVENMRLCTEVTVGQDDENGKGDEGKGGQECDAQTHAVQSHVVKGSLSKHGLHRAETVESWTCR